MENRFADLMLKHSDEKLQEIVSNRKKYDLRAYKAAVEELQKRNLASPEVIAAKEEAIQKDIEAWVAKSKNNEIETNKRKAENKFAFKALIYSLKPSKRYFYTPILIYLNIVVFIIMVSSGVNAFEPSASDLYKWGGNIRTATLGREYWRLLTNIFLHGGLFHLLFNMYALLNVGSLLEKKFGNHRFLLVYIVTGILASIASVAYHENTVSVGASGAIFGIYGLFLALLISKNYRVPEDARKNLLSSIAVFIGYNLFYGFVNKGIDNAAHIGGLLSGFLIGLAYYPSFRTPRYAVFISSGLVFITLICVFLAPKFISNSMGAFQKIIPALASNENKALWIDGVDFSDSTKTDQYYYDKLQYDGIELWDKNLELLKSVSDMSPDVQKRVDLLTEYCNLRKEQYKVLQSFIKYEGLDQQRLVEVNTLIEAKVHELEALNK